MPTPNYQSDSVGLSDCPSVGTHTQSDPYRGSESG
jgi:hypothetical protein